MNQKRKVVKLIVICAAAASILLFFKLNLGHYLTLDTLKSNETALRQSYEAHRGTFILAYMGIYIAAAALSIPGATVLTLAGGALFGFGLGTVLVSVASTVGATLAFWVSRFLFRGWVEKKFGGKLRAFNEGVRKEGAFYLFTLRLVPIFPFFLVNLLMGLTPIRSPIFFIVSEIGMLPGTAAYVNAGTQLSQIQSSRGILSPSLLLSFAVIGILPLISKWVISAVKARKVYSGFSKPKSFDYNLVVIGAGSAGLVSAYIGSAIRAKVALVEKHKMGGDCLNTGCVPSKALIRSAKMLSYASRAREFGFDEAQVKFDFAQVMERVQRVISQVSPHDSVERYRGLGVECIQGAARVSSPWTVEVNGRTLKAKNIILATGASPLVPNIPGLDTVPYLTSDTVWGLRKRPRRLLVLGGGPIGCELAQSFRRFGSQVTQVEMEARIMMREDPEVSEFVARRFKAEGVQVLTGHRAKSFHSKEGRKWLVCEFQGQEVEIEFDEVLLALGRKANVKGFGLEELGIEISPRGTIASDQFLRTKYPNIFVCGDAAGPFQFTHTAAHQAWFASVNALFSPFKKFRADYRVIPWATFTDPEVGRVGLNETEAQEKGIEYTVSRYGIDDLDRAIAEEEAHGFVKVLTPPGKDKILGVTIVGSHAGDIISEFVLAMKHGLGLNRILGTIHIYPTLAEANKYVAGQWKKDHAPRTILGLLEKFHAWRRG